MSRTGPDRESSLPSSPTPSRDPGSLDFRLCLSSSTFLIEDPVSLFFLLRGFAPARRGPFVSAKGPKTSGARAGPPEKPKVVILNAVKNLFFVGSRSLIESSFATLRTSVALRQSSPPYGMDGTGAQPRQQAPRPGIRGCAFCHARLDRASRVVGLPLFLKQCDKLYKTVQNVQHVHIVQCVQHIQNCTNCTKSDREAPR